MTEYRWSEGWLTTRSPRATDRGITWGAPARRPAEQRIGDRVWPSVPPLDRVDELAEALVPPTSHGHDHPVGHARVRDWIADPLWNEDLADGQVWELDVVVDGSRSMPGWDDTVADFVAALRRRRAFRAIDVLELDTDLPDLALTRPLDRRLVADEPAASGRSPRMVLVVTDGLGTAWAGGAALELLRQWGRDAVVAIVHLLPANLWGITGISPQRVRLRAPSAGGPSVAMEWSGAGGGGFPVPVLELNARWLRTWTRFLARSLAWTDLQVVVGSPKWTTAGTAPTAAQQVSDFRSSASGAALHLATLLAAAPLNLPVIRMIQGKWLPLTRPHHLVEIQAAGLLRPVVDPAEVFAPDRITYEFAPGVSRQLLGLSRRSTTGDVARTAADCLGYYVDCVREFGAVLRDPTVDAPALTAADAPYHEVFRAVLEALSGPYLVPARRLAGY